MQNNIVKKGLAIGIIVLFFCINIQSTSTKVQQSTRTLFYSDNTLYVGGSGPNNYTRIQDAINDSVDGDTVFVYDDSSPYVENINVYKKINLIGEDKNTTIIDAYEQNYAIATFADFVTISGFTITSNKTIYGNKNHSGIQIFSSFNMISENIFKRNEKCITIFISYNSNRIYDNIFQNNTMGIYIKGSSFNNIFNNSFVSNWCGIYVFEGIENIITNNTFIKRMEGIYLAGNSNKIFNNIILSLETGIEISNCSNNEIINNNINLNYYGIHFRSNADNNTIQNNSLHQNWRSIRIRFNCDYNLLEKNKILNSDGNGILISGDYNLLEKNNIINSHEYGIHIEGSNNDIHFNYIKGHLKVGIEISGSSNNISYNAIENNTIGISLLQNSKNNMIKFNNIIKNNAFFTYTFLQRMSKNVWDSNYWDQLIGNVKIIIGVTKILLYLNEGKGHYYEISLYLPGLNFDWHPAKEPYDIPDMEIIENHYPSTFIIPVNTGSNLDPCTFKKI